MSPANPNFKGERFFRVFNLMMEPYESEVSMNWYSDSRRVPDMAIEGNWLGRGMLEEFLASVYSLLRACVKSWGGKGYD